MTTEKTEPTTIPWTPEDWESPTFDPDGDGVLMNLGSDAQPRWYMQVAKRVLWFVQEQRQAIAEGAKRGERLSYTFSSEPRILDLEKGIAVFHTVITDVYGNHAEGWGSCSAKKKPSDYIEFAETKANGRALAKLGYGTQFAGLDADDDEDGVVDAPQEPRKSPPPPPPRSAPPVSPDRPPQLLSLTSAASRAGYKTDNQFKAAWNTFRGQAKLSPAAQPGEHEQDFLSWLTSHPLQNKTSNV